MKELLGKLSEKVSETTDAAREAFEANINFAKFSEKFTGMTDSAKENSVKFMNDLLALPPIIEEMGFNTVGITVSLGLPPDVTFHFEKFDEIPAEKREAILAMHKDKMMLNTVVKMLFVADDYRQKLKLGNFRFTNIDICIGITGGVSFQLVPKNV